MNTVIMGLQTKERTHRTVIKGVYTAEQMEDIKEILTCTENLEEMLGILEDEGYTVIEPDHNGTEETEEYALLDIFEEGKQPSAA